MAPFFTGIAKNIGGYGFGRRRGGPVPFSATGGTLVSPGNGYNYHVFLTPGTFTVTSGTANVEYLVVAGGGAGAYDGRSPSDRQATGGGAGGLRTNSPTAPAPLKAPDLPLDAGTYPVSVGSGGVGGFVTGPGSDGFRVGNKGGDSTFHTITSNAGGGGLGHYPPAGGNVTPDPSVYKGGSGSGGNGPSTPDGNFPPTSPPQGNPSGPVSVGPGASVGGAGGAGGIGGPGNTGTGGAGLAVPAFAAPLISPAIPAPVQPSWIPAVGPTGLYAGGGGSTSNFVDGTIIGSGGPGGGGSAGRPAGSPGVTYTGGGGGGSGGSATYASGGTGIVIVRYII